MTKYRAVANGNIVDDVPESLVEAGIYERIGEPEKVTKPSPAPAREPVKPLTTTDAPAKPAKVAKPKKAATTRKKGGTKKARKPAAEK